MQLKSVSRHAFDVTKSVAACAVVTRFWRRDRKPHCGLKGGRDMGNDVATWHGFPGGCDLDLMS